MGQPTCPDALPFKEKLWKTYVLKDDNSKKSPQHAPKSQLESGHPVLDFGFDFG